LSLAIPERRSAPSNGPTGRQAEQGFDFADAWHLGRAQGCSAFMSFDRKLAKAAAGLSDVEIVVPRG